ncbi:MAG: phenylacetate--CoA ligase [Deltaproteobacteria bacterium]|nr:phenylacetate--CoA ligase [Deltaproteobacteria bacterium]
MSGQSRQRHPISAADYLSLDALHATQLSRLRRTVQRAYDNVPLLRQRMQQRGLAPADVRSLGDVTALPFTVKDDLRDTYPFGLLASPMKEIVRLHASSGTTGKPIVVAYTPRDIAVWTETMMRSYASCGMHDGDIVQIAYGYGLFTGGLGAHYGVEALGATVIPAAAGHTERQLMLMQDFGVTAVCCTPSYFLHLIDQAQQMGIDIEALPLRLAVMGAEPWTEGMRRRIETEAGIEAYDMYGLSEIIGPGVGIECACRSGLHVFEDHFLAEVIDPETLERVPDGTEGELVLTTLSKEAMPMIRYRTRDITAFVTGPCDCGRSLRRIRRIGRRSDDMLIVRGVNVYPSQIEAALLRVEGTLPHYQIVLTRDQDLDRMEVQVEVAPAAISDPASDSQELQTKIAHSIESTTGIHAVVRLVAPRTIQRSEGKARRVIDQRAM